MIISLVGGFFETSSSLKLGLSNLNHTNIAIKIFIQDED